MGGVDLSDQKIQSYEISRKTYRWYHQIADNLMDMVIFNSNIIYNILHNNSKLSNLDFRKKLIEGLLQKYSKFKTSHVDPEENKKLHVASKIPSDTGKLKKLRCYNCKNNGKRSDTTIWCVKCENTPLCKRCFEIFPHYEADSSLEE